MNKKVILILSAYLISIVLGNLIVFHLGRWGVLITSLIFIPFDFVIRCYIHELYRGRDLYQRLFFVIFLGGVATFAINHGAENIALGSVIGFVCASIVGSIFYQLTRSKHTFLKVNGSDILALIADSLVFQMIAFGSIVPLVIAGQIGVKILGGLAWYWVLFVKFDLLKSVNEDFKIVGRWEDSLMGFPSQCMLKVKYKEAFFLVYLRWRWSNPWTCDLIQVDEKEWSRMDTDGGTWFEIINNPPPGHEDYFKEEELKALKKHAIKKIKRELSGHFLYNSELKSSENGY